VLHAPPVLTTERLVLRVHDVSDFEPMLALWQDERIYRDITGRASTREESWMRLLRYRGLWPLLGFGYWAVTLRDGGRYIGDAGLADFHRDLDPAIDGDPEAGWMLHPDHWRRGLMSEALAAIFQWADGTLKPSRLVCMISPGNEASFKLAAGHGFRPFCEATYKGGAVRLFERLRPQA